MALQIVSDLHLEAPKAYDFFSIIPHAPHLALLGDIGNIVTHKADMLEFLTHQLKQFRTVLFIPGNHEPYGSDWPTTLAILRAFEEDVRGDSTLGSFVLLDRTIFQLPDTDVTILGCSLFSSIPSEQEMAVSVGLNDFFYIANWEVRAHTAAHERDVAWLNEQVDALKQTSTKIVILTHWSPSVDDRSTDPKHVASSISCAYSTDLSSQPCFRSGKVKLWAFGHTHYNCDFEVARGGDAGPLRLVANQRGYYFAQAVGFDPEKRLEV
ncbi:hypothetical protein N0V90_008196 [Kalmusia sp. IMI 367209]|nr:hypothetical protein N0V90_008196 [Kalmusia sp. IMI 367209]